MVATHSTIRILSPYSLAADERARLFAGLQEFANLGNSAEDFESFARQWPGFSPVVIRKGGLQGEPFGLIPALRPAVLRYRDLLRRVWRSDPDVDRLGLADMLLGLQIEEANPVPGPPRRGGLRKLVSLKSMIASLTPHDSDQRAVLPTVVASWKMGDFNYHPLNDFQMAFYLLFREKWRARTCAQCSRYFIADKSAQSYCSTACYGKARRGRSLRWWKAKGDAKRRERMLKARRRRALGRRK